MPREPVFLALEGELGCELDTTWAAATEERVTDSYVASGGKVIAANSHLPICRTRLKSVSAWIGNERRQERICKIRVVQQVEEVGAELHVKPLGKHSGLVDCEVPLLVGWTA